MSDAPRCDEVRIQRKRDLEDYKKLYAEVREMLGDPDKGTGDMYSIFTKPEYERVTGYWFKNMERNGLCKDTWIKFIACSVYYNSLGGEIKKLESLLRRKSPELSTELPAPSSPN